MDGRRFDNLTRLITRRGFFAAAGGIAAFVARGANASQPGPATCGQSGDVCTRLIGCCSGFTCVTSAINVNYGICVSGGSGGTVSTGTGLISPFSEDLDQEIAMLQADPALTATSTALTPEQKKAEIQARRDARQSRRSSRRSTRRSNIDSRRTTRRNEQDQQEEADRIAAGPLIEGEIFSPGGPDSGKLGPETLTVRNRDTSAIVLTRIESLLDSSDGQSFNDSRLPSLQVGESYNFYSDAGMLQGKESLDDKFELAWAGGPICTSAGTGAGFRVFAAFNSSSPNREYKFFCDTLFTPAPEREVPDAIGNRRRRKRKQRARQRNKANGQSQKSKKRKR